MSLQRKLRDQNDKKVLKDMFGKEPKRRCPICHRFSIWVTNDKVKNQCVMCELIRRTREERKNDDTGSEDSGE